MNDPTQCDRFKEDLPLLFSGQLDDQKKLRMQMHLETCRECRSFFRSEAVLMSVASADRDQDLLGDHPGSETLDSYVHSPSSLDSSDITRIEQHIESCAQCRDTVAKLRLLPRELGDLISPQETPFISDVVAPQVVDIGDIRKARPATAVPWRWIGALAAAALVVLVSVSLVTDRYPGGLRQSRVEMEFIDSGETTRLQELRRAAADKPVVSEVGGWISLEIAFDAYPEEESYRVVIEGADGEVLDKTVSADDFSLPGRLIMKVRTAELRSGEYLLRLHVYKVDPQAPLSTLTFPFVLDRD